MLQTCPIVDGLSLRLSTWFKVLADSVTLHPRTTIRLTAWSTQTNVSVYSNASTPSPYLNGAQSRHIVFASTDSTSSVEERGNKRSQIYHPIHLYISYQDAVQLSSLQRRIRSWDELYLLLDVRCGLTFSQPRL